MSMNALVYSAPNQKAWKLVPIPTIQSSTDAIVKLTSTTICGTDLHILKGDVPTVPRGTILGHEGVGIVQSVGNSVSNFKPGERVLISCITSCGKCVYCMSNLQAHCLNGGWILGNEIDGTQAEYVRIPYADTSLYAAPSALKDETLLMLSDALPTGFEIGVQSAKIAPGNTVAIVGAGPVGMAVLITAQFYCPASIIVIDTDDYRLAVAERNGATGVINPNRLTKNSILDEIMELLKSQGFSNVDVTGQNTIPGVDVAVECAGLPQTFDICQKIIAPGGRIANVGVHGRPVDLQLQDLWSQNVTITTGVVSATTTSMLLKILQSGKMNASVLVTHHFKLSQIEKAYDVFGNAANEHAIKMSIEADGI
ncbi:chaperonin 10-like protein [Lipomyces kononenkoae]|uniref:Chaperonin 10-like protein n=1 Tax=Lipomyces kononenkoae TaxID=34357 RepID=A0ACC3SZ57_LIPKO